MAFFNFPRELRNLIYREILASQDLQNPDRDLGKIWHLPDALGGTMQDDFPLRMRQRLPTPSFERLFRINSQFTSELCEEIRAAKHSAVLELDLLLKTATRKLRHNAQSRNPGSSKPYSFDATIAPPLSASTVHRKLKVWTFDRLDPRLAACITTIRLRVPNTTVTKWDMYGISSSARFREFVRPLKKFLSSTGSALMAHQMPNIRTFEVAFADFWHPLTHQFVDPPVIRCLDLRWISGTIYMGGQAWPVFSISKARLQEWLENVSVRVQNPPFCFLSLKVCQLADLTH